MKILYVPSDMDAPGCYRCLFPARQLAQHDVQVKLPSFEMNEQADGRINFQFDIQLSPPTEADIWVLQQRMERMWAEEGVQRLRQAGIVTVADVDDNYEELPYWNPAFYGTHPYRRGDETYLVKKETGSNVKVYEKGGGYIVNREERRRIKKATGVAAPNKHNRDHMKAMFAVCDALTVSTPYLKELYGHYNKNVHVLRNMVDWDIWEKVKPQYNVKGRRLRLGYLGVFRFRKGDLEVIRDVVRPIMLRHPEVDFVANHEDVHDYLGIPHEQRITVGEYMFYPKDGGKYEVGERTAVMDIGLIPLKPSGMSEAKSHLKGMEYNAAGIPFVASPSESYKDYWCDGLNGFLAFNKSDWTDRIEFLIANDTTRRVMGRAGRKKAKQNSYQKQWPLWYDVYSNLVGGRYETLARGAIVRGAVQKVSELATMLRAADSIGPLKTIVEVGSARGGTFWAFSQIADERAMMVSIDIPAGSPIDVRGGKDVYFGRDRDRFNEFVQEKQHCRLIDANSQLESTVQELRRTLGQRQIDLLFIDADHRYEGVKRDYELYSPLVRPGGLIGFHDVIRQNDPRSGVHLLWAELKKKHPQAVEYVGKDNWGMGSWGGVGFLVAA